MKCSIADCYNEVYAKWTDSRYNKTYNLCKDCDKSLPSFISDLSVWSRVLLSDRCFITDCESPITHRCESKIDVGRLIAYACAKHHEEAMAYPARGRYYEFFSLEPERVQPKFCSCSMTDIMRHGCKCGGK